MSCDKGREHQRARSVLERIGGAGVEVAEQQRLLVGAVVGVGFPQRVRVDAQALDILVALAARTCGVVARRPQGHPAERRLEEFDGPRRRGVDHLLVEARIGLARLQAVLGQDVAVVQVHGRIAGLAGGIDVDDLQVFADRTRQERFPAHVGDRFIQLQRVERGRERRVVGVDSQLAAQRRLQGRRERVGPLLALLQLGYAGQGWRRGVRRRTGAGGDLPRRPRGRRRRLGRGSQARQFGLQGFRSAGMGSQGVQDRLSGGRIVGRMLRIRQQPLQRPALGKLQRLQFKHPLPVGDRRFRRAEAGDDPEQRERRAVGGLFGEGGRIRRLMGQGGRRFQDAAAEMDRVGPFGGREQRLPYGLHPAPAGMAGQVGRVAGKPDRRRGGDLRRRRRRAGTIVVDDVGATQPRPRHVGRECGHGRFHLRGRAVVPRHLGDRQVGVRRAVAPDAAGGDHAIEAGGEDDVARRQFAEVVAGGGDDDHALFVKGVDRLGPTPGWRRRPCSW